jgi:hypothetical protein
MTTDPSDPLKDALRNLPLRPAPARLRSAVMARIRTEAAKPWWQLSTDRWPIWARLTLPTTVVLGTAALTFVWSLGINGTLQAAQRFILSKTEPLRWIPRAGETLLQACLQAASRHSEALQLGAVAAGVAILVCLLVTAGSATALLRLRRASSLQ